MLGEVGEVSGAAELYRAIVNGDRVEAVVLVNAQRAEELGEAEVLCNEIHKLGGQAGVADRVAVPHVRQHATQTQSDFVLIHH